MSLIIIKINILYTLKIYKYRNYFNTFLLLLFCLSLLYCLSFKKSLMSSDRDESSYKLTFFQFLSNVVFL